MDDLRQLLRYEIPGLIAIIYFFLISHPILLSYTEEIGICIKQISESTLEITGSAVILALPLGSLLLMFYHAIEYGPLLKERIGLTEIKNILEENDLSDELEWCNKDKTHARMNEIFDMISYNYEEKLTNILERFLTYYHSGNVIKVYAPLSAIIAVGVSDVSYLWFLMEKSNVLTGDCKPCLFLIVFVFLLVLLLLYYLSILLDPPEECKKPKIEIVAILCCLIVITHIATLFYFSKPCLLVVFSAIMILAISLIMKKKNLLLKKQIDELEKNIVRLHRKEIVETIDRAMKKEETCR
jgi:hypothetical protein